MTVLVMPGDARGDSEAEFVEVARASRSGDWHGLSHAGRGARDEEFEAFAAAAASELGRTAWMLTGDVHRASELVQTALVQTYLAWPRARETEPLAYARRVLANARIDGWRRRRREVLVPPEDLPETGWVPEPGLEVDGRDELVRALAVLSTGQRRVVVLRYLVGLSQREVAADLGLSEGTVKTHAARGLARLRRELEATRGWADVMREVRDA